MDEANNERIDIYNAFAIESPWWRRKVNFFYIDTIDYKADRLIEKHGIRINHFGDAIGETYAICSCRIPKKQIEDFLEAMYELQNLMIICGHKDYKEHCVSVRNKLMGEDEDD